MGFSSRGCKRVGHNSEAEHKWAFCCLINRVAMNISTHVPLCVYVYLFLLKPQTVSPKDTGLLLCFYPNQYLVI